MVVPQSRPFRSGKILGDFDRNFSADTASSLSVNGPGNLDQISALSSLKDLIAAGDHRLDTMLATLTEAAWQLTGASGAALAMWKEGAMVCRARSGDTAPALGARLNADTGISGECLRTGKIQYCKDTENDPLVDVEVCRRLGLRSIAVLPIQGWRGVNGILEVFSTRPGAFGEQHISVLQQLAALAERARATQPHGASAAIPKPSNAIETPKASGLLPASDRVLDVALAFVDHRSRPFVLGGISLGAIALLALVIWLGSRGPDEAGAKTTVPTPVVVSSSTAHAVAEQAAAASSPEKHAPDSDRVWKANPGGEALFASNGKPSAGATVKFASKVDVLAGKKTAGSPLLADLADKVAAKAAVPRGEVAPETVSAPDDSIAAEAPAITAGGSNESALDGVLSAKAFVPGFASAKSQGVTGGQLVSHGSPVYPAEALHLRLEGRVILAATVMEDGTVRDVKVVEGSPVLAPSALEAVRHWRYKPYMLDGKPVKNSVRINVDFKFPADASR